MAREHRLVFGDRKLHDDNLAGKFESAKFNSPMTTLSALQLKQRSGQFDAASIQRVDLADLVLGNIDALTACTSLVDLSLRNNQVPRRDPAGSDRHRLVILTH